MADERELYDGYNGEQGDAPDFPYEAGAPADEELAAGESPLRSIEDFDRQLKALEAYDPQDEGGAALDEALGALPDEPVLPGEALMAGPRAEMDAQRAAAARAETAISALDQTERLRTPRAQGFRRRLRHQVGMLPLALLLIALGAYLLVREHDLADVPDLSTLILVGLTVLGLGFTFIFHALLSGRRERGLLFLGLYIWITAGVIGVIAYGIDLQPDAREWWPALLWSLGLTLLVTFLLERAHDVRLVLLAVLVAVAGGVAYWVTSGEADAQLLDDVADYWPLLLAVLGVGLLPAALRRGAR